MSYCPECHTDLEPICDSLIIDNLCEVDESISFECPHCNAVLSLEFEIDYRIYPE